MVNADLDALKGERAECAEQLEVMRAKYQARSQEWLADTISTLKKQLADIDARIAQIASGMLRACDIVPF